MHRIMTSMRGCVSANDRQAKGLFLRKPRTVSNMTSKKYIDLRKGHSGRAAANSSERKRANMRDKRITLCIRDVQVPR